MTDTQTGLVWLANANCFQILDWVQAMAAVEGLSDLPDDGTACSTLTSDECDRGLSDGSSPGEWRLPSIAEWEAMIDTGCTPTISNDQDNDCWDTRCFDSGACSFYGVQSEFYWSSSSDQRDLTKAWPVSLLSGGIAENPKIDTLRVWPVRGGQ